MLTPYLPLLPRGARTISPHLAVVVEDGYLVVYNASGPINRCAVDDAEGLRLLAGTLSSLGLAGLKALGGAFGMDPSTVFRNRKRLEEGGAEGVRSRRRGAKRPHKLNEEVCARIQRHLGRGWSKRRAAEEVGVSEGAVRAAIRRGQLSDRPQAPNGASPVRGERGNGPVLPVPPQQACGISGPAERAAQDQACEQGVGVKRTAERALACVGGLSEAPAEFEVAEAVPGAGVLLGLPALLDQGLIDVGQGVYGSLRNGYYGLRSVLLTFCFMALLRIKNLEQLKTWAPGELGLVLGLDRAPVVETMRRKLHEMGKRQLARSFQKALTERWALAEPDLLGLLFVDGHVRPYHGKHELPEHHVQRRGRPMPGTQDFHVNDRGADPLFHVTAEATESLLAVLEEQLLPEIRRLVGPTRRVTVVFDREGWSPERFARWKDQNFDVLTYRKGEQSRWQERFFTKRTCRVDGRMVTYRLAERRVNLSNELSVREVRRLMEDGHQTAVITTCEDLSTFQVAHRMFSRWRQENFFRYMRHEFAIDHLCTTNTELADPKRQVPNPERTKLEKELKRTKASLGQLVVRLGDLKPGQKARAEGRTLTQDQIEALIRQREREIDRLKARAKELPKQVALDQIRDPQEIVRLEPERKLITDAFKMIAYRAESALAPLIEPLVARHEDETRKFLQTVFQATADLVPDERTRTLTVRFHGLSTPRATRALQALCEIVSATDTRYPGTALRLRFQAPQIA